MKLFNLTSVKLGSLTLAFTGVRLYEPKDAAFIINKLRSKGGFIFQALDPLAVASSKHILLGVALALKSYDEDRMIARDLNIEVMLYLAGVRQIKEAIAKVGIKGFSREVVLLCLARGEEEALRLVADTITDLGGVDDETLVDDIEPKAYHLMKTYSISEEEVKSSMTEESSWFEALIRCVLSRVAMVDVLKELAS